MLEHSKSKGIKKKIYFCITDYSKHFVYITTNWTILKEIGISDHFACLLRNLYVGQETAVRLDMEQ